MTTTTQRPSEVRTGAVMALTAVMAAAAAAIGLTLSNQPPATTPFTLDLLAVIVITAIAELTAINRPTAGHNHTLSLSEIALVIGLAFSAPMTLVLGRVLAGLIVYGGIRRIPSVKLAFNTALFALETAAAAAIYRLVLDTASPATPRGWIAATAGIAAATVIGLSAVRMILAIHGQPRPRATTHLSLAITLGATLIGILGVTALTAHTTAAVVITALTGIAYLAMRALPRFNPPTE